MSEDGQEIAVVDHPQGDISVSSIENGQLTHFPDDDRRIQDFEWSADGKRLAFSRSKTTWGIGLFRGLETGR